MIEAVGVVIKNGVTIGKDVSWADVEKQFDAVFLDKDLRVVRLAERIPAWRALSAKGARSVLELAAGEISSRGVQIADELAIGEIMGDLHGPVEVA